MIEIEWVFFDNNKTFIEDLRDSFNINSGLKISFSHPVKKKRGVKLIWLRFMSKTFAASLQ